MSEQIVSSPPKDTGPRQIPNMILIDPLRSEVRSVIHGMPEGELYEPMHIFRFQDQAETTIAINVINTTLNRLASERRISGTTIRSTQSQPDGSIVVTETFRPNVAFMKVHYSQEDGSKVQAIVSLKPKGIADELYLQAEGTLVEGANEEFDKIRLFRIAL